MAAQSECHLCFHWSMLSSLCAEPDNGSGAGGKKKKSLHDCKVSGNFIAALSLSNVFPLGGGQVTNLPYVRFKSEREESML